MVELYIFSFVNCQEEEMCLGCLVKGCCLSQTYPTSQIEIEAYLFFFKCHIQSGVNKRQLFLKKNLIFNFLVS